ncbi:MAG: hypothetical protein K6F53_08270 [Lachnospiraceae bacterium]|nr:hypothetical protein [Lachnospiraceae bacterium]
MDATVLMEEKTMTSYGRERKVRMIRQNRRARRIGLVKAAIALSVFLIVAAGVLCYYIQLLNSVKDDVKSISVMESRLENIREDNDDAIRRINSAEDIESIRRVAIQELGMRYAKEAQIVMISGEEEDYLVQIRNIPETP